MTLPAVVHMRTIDGREWRIYMLSPTCYEIEHRGQRIKRNANHNNWPNPGNKRWTKLDTAMKWLDRKEASVKAMKQAWQEDRDLRAENKRLKRRVAQLEKQVKKLKEGR